MERTKPEGKRINLKVAASTDSAAVAGAAVRFIDEGTKVEMSAIGAGAISQMMKAVVLARGMASVEGRDLFFTCGFRKKIIDGKEKSILYVFVHSADEPFWLTR